MPKVYDADTLERAKPVIVLASDGTISGAGGDATAANQDEQTALLTTIDADTGTIAGDTTVLSAASTTIDTALGANDRGFRVLFRRDDALTTLTPADGDAVMGVTDEYGRIYVNQAALAASVDNVSIGASVTGGYTPMDLIDIDETEDEVKATAGKVGGWVLTNLAASTRYVRFYNATAANTTVGTTAAEIVVAIPATSGVVMPLGGPGIAFSTAICVAATTGVAANDTGAPGANEIVGTIFFI